VKARLYLDGQTLGEIDVAEHASGLRPGARLTLALVELHPTRPHRPLFMSGLLETAEPMRTYR
jgi:hypothetical protein